MKRKMKKSEIPMPKFDIGDYVTYIPPSENLADSSPPKKLGEVEQIFIHLKSTGAEVNYIFKGADMILVDERRCIRRAMA